MGNGDLKKGKGRLGPRHAEAPRIPRRVHCWSMYVKEDPFSNFWWIAFLVDCLFSGATVHERRSGCH